MALARRISSSSSSSEDKCRLRRVEEGEIKVSSLSKLLLVDAAERGCSKEVALLLDADIVMCAARFENRICQFQLNRKKSIKNTLRNNNDNKILLDEWHLACIKQE